MDTRLHSAECSDDTSIVLRVPPRMDSNAGSVDSNDLQSKITKLQEELNEANKKIEWLLQNIQNSDLIEKFKQTRQIPQATTETTKQTSSISEEQPNGTPITEALSPTNEPAKKPGTSKEKSRELVLKELIDTERDYVRDLELIIKLFYNPLEERGILSKEDMSLLFSNIPVLVQVNKQLLEGFENRQAENIAIKMAGLLKMYTNYCANQNITLNNLDRIKKSNDKFAHFLQDVQENPESRGLGLNAYLIKPVQRLCKYPLLFRELLKNTAEDSPEYEQITKILKKISESVDYVNERTRQVENQQKIIEISNSLENAEEIELVTPSRRFVSQHDLGLIKKKKKKPHPVTLFVFNDLVLVAKNTTKNKYKAKDRILMKDLRLIEVADTDDHQFVWELQSRNTSSTIKLASSSEDDKKKVTQLLKSLLREVQKKEIQDLKRDSYNGSLGSIDSFSSSPATSTPSSPAPFLAENRRRSSVESLSPLERQPSDGPTRRSLVHSGSGSKDGSWNFAKPASSPRGSVEQTTQPLAQQPSPPQSSPSEEAPKETIQTAEVKEPATPQKEPERNSTPSTPQKEPEQTDSTASVPLSSSNEKNPTPRLTHMDSATILKELVGITKPKKEEDTPKRAPRVKTMKITKSELEEYKTEEAQKEAEQKKILPNPNVTWSAGRSKQLLRKLRLNSVSSATQPSPRDPNKTYHVMNDLLQKEYVQSQGLDMKSLETYLSPEEFFEVFGITNEDFIKLPQWKRVEAKKIVGLF